mgnify:CR=1 FL=1
MYKNKKIKVPRIPLAVDFDGVIHAYLKGLADGSIYDDPVPGVSQAMRRLRKNHNVYVYSHRTGDKGGRDAIRGYLLKHKIPFDEVAHGKPPAKFYIDDRAIRFKNWRQALRELKRFEAELKRGKNRSQK